MTRRHWSRSARTLRSDPIPVIGGYSIDLYCRYETGEFAHDSIEHGHGVASFAGHNEANCLKQARQAGWIIHRDNTVTCPHCAGRRKP